MGEVHRLVDERDDFGPRSLRQEVALLDDHREFVPVDADAVTLGEAFRVGDVDDLAVDALVECGGERLEEDGEPRLISAHVHLSLMHI